MCTIDMCTANRYVYNRYVYNRNNVYNRMCIVHNVVYCTHPIKLRQYYVYNTSLDWLQTYY